MKRRSFFGPMLLITVGVIWLLVSLRVIPYANLWALAQALPFVLMALGAGLLLRARWENLGWVVTGLVMLALVGVVLFAPQLGWNHPVTWGFDPGIGGAQQGSGAVKTEDRKLGDFQSVSIKFPAEITIQQGSAVSAKVTADDNLLPQLNTEVRDGVLYIENKEKDWDLRVDPSRTVKIMLTVKDLNEIRFSSAGIVTVDGLETEDLRIVLSGAGEFRLNDVKLGALDATLSGAGNIQASGSADVLKLTISGLGSFDAPNLQTLQADIRISGAGSARVRVKDQLAAHVSGAGSVDYYGSPTVERNISGAGSVNAVDD